jgi:hypothetical protein
VTAKTGIKQAIHSVVQLFAAPGPASVPRRLSLPSAEAVKATSTGLRPLDKATDLRGLPHGVIIELLEPGNSMSSGGAALVAAKIAARVQRQQEMVSVVDLCRGFDPWQAERAGLVAPHLLLTRPDTVFDAVASLETAAGEARLVVVVLGPVPDLLSHIEPRRLKTLLRRLQTIVRGSDSIFLFLTAPTQQDPFAPENYPPGFPLADVAALRLWLQDETFSYSDGVPTAYKATLTVIKNELALAGKGAKLRIKLG